MTLKTVKVPEQFEPLFEKAEEVVSAYFSKRREDPSKGTIEIFESRYVMVRGAALSVEFFGLVEELFGKEREKEARDFARNILYDLAYSIGKSDARNFHAKMNLEDPIDKLSAGPVHFAHTGWAFVDIFPESNPTPDDNYFLIYDHPYSFESDAWKQSDQEADFPVCVMNAGYSSGWCEESFGIKLVATEILCQARGDDVCRFIMAPPGRIEEHVKRYAKEKPELAKRMANVEIPDLFSRKKLEFDLSERVKELPCLYDISKLTEDTSLGFEEVLKRIADRIPQALQFPDLVHVRIVIDGKQYSSEGFKSSDCILSEDILSEGNVIGHIEVYYSRKASSEGQSCFLTEEAQMIEAVADQIGNLKERVDSTRKLKEFDEKKSEFVSAVAHELRSPLATIRGGISLVLDGVHGKLNDNQERALTISKNNIDRLVRITNNLLDLSRIEAGKIEMHTEKFDLKALVEQIVEANQEMIKQQGLEIRTAFPAGPLEIEADPDLLTQVFTNLIGNACKFTDAGFVEMGIEDKGDAVRCWVRDTGIGISEEDLGRIFERFEQSSEARKSREKGTGLGLSIAKGIIELLGGKINVTSELGKGTEFSFMIPKKPAQKDAQGPEKP